MRRSGLFPATLTPPPVRGTHKFSSVIALKVHKYTLVMVGNHTSSVELCYEVCKKFGTSHIWHPSDVRIVKDARELQACGRNRRKRTID